MSKYWTTQTGEDIAYKDLKDDHLLNIISFVERKADEGMEIIYGISDAEGTEGDIQHLEDKEVLSYFDYEGLLEEARKRKLIS